MSHPLARWLTVALCLIQACETPVDAEGDAEGELQVDVGVHGGTGETVERDEACDEYDDGTYGARVPWTGFEYDGTTYTCNGCRGGLSDLHGTWRLLDFDTEDPDVALADSWTQTFTFDGNTWRQEATWQAGGAPRAESMEGWYWCGSKPELQNEAKVFVVTGLTPSDAFGYVEGYVFTADLLSSADGGDRLAFLFYEGFNTGSQLAEVYCRVGTSVTTLAGETKPCIDPFN
ncbi:MAG: hypothetical protein QF464_20845 [Myxococcota bacterium]|jgi:hypothetical protein|nr:hypothetical protein [Myxococcota bacterium]